MIDRSQDHPDDTSQAERTLQLKRLTIQAGSNELIRDASLTISPRRITVIVGGSGAGKSMLLRAIAGLIPSDGEGIRWQGEIDFGEADRCVGVVFQQFALFDELSPTENVRFAIDHRVSPAAPASQTADEWLNELGVPTKTRVNRLSGGQKQRLAIARTLAAEPRIVLYDEPTSGLDAASGRKVAELIQKTHQAHHRTSIIVTHDYETLIPIADEVLLLDSKSKQLVAVPKEQWDDIPKRMEPVTLDAQSAPAPGWRQRLLGRFDEFVSASGAAVIAAIRLPYDALPVFPRWTWGLRFVAHYLRLVGGPSAWVYLVLAGLIIGFTSTYFTFKFLPFRLYTQPLLIDELLASIGFALYRILVPVLATILIAARCGAAVAADVGVKRYGGQVDALKTLGVSAKSYLLAPIVVAFLIATPVLEWLAFTAAKSISLLTFTMTHPDVGPFFWSQHFHRNLAVTTENGIPGWGWVLIKNLVCGLGTAAIGYYRGIAPKHSASDVSAGITSTVLWATLYVLIVHFLIALLEF